MQLAPDKLLPCLTMSALRLNLSHTPVKMSRECEGFPGSQEDRRFPHPTRCKTMTGVTLTVILHAIGVDHDELLQHSRENCKHPKSQEMRRPELISVTRRGSVHTEHLIALYGLKIHTEERSEDTFAERGHRCSHTRDF